MTGKFKAGLEEWGLASGPEILDRFDKYRRLLAEKNGSINLTAITDPAEVETLHFLDSLALFRAAGIHGRVIDVGSGAGFPGLPLKLVDPLISLTLLDSHGKKVDFLRELTRLLDAGDTQCVQGRAEEQSLLPGYRDSYDFALSRAVAQLNILCELCLPFVRPGGMFLAMKSTASDGEIKEAENAVKLLGGELAPGLDYTVPGTDIAHRVVIVRKKTPTPKGYPRRFSRIQKSPL